MGLKDRLQHAWNAFNGRDPTEYYDYGPVYFSKPDRTRLSRSSEKSIISAIYTRMAVDAASNKLVHAIIDLDGNYLDTIDDHLNQCLNLSANIDQSGRAFIQDVVMSLLDEGLIAIVPVDTDLSPIGSSNKYDILSMRCGKVKQWMPEEVKVEVFNQKTQMKQEVLLPKKAVAIVENPFYAVMNEPNSTAQRLKRKMNQLDDLDNRSTSGKLDMIIQMPYNIRSEARKQDAERRRSDLEKQLAESKYGIGYTDATEKIVQLNRSIENNLLDQIKYYTEQLYSQLSMTPEVLNGTASPDIMNNYYNRTIEPILGTIADEMKRKFLTKTAITQGHTIMYLQNPFKLIPINELANVADALERNAVLTSNEFRGILGKAPIDDPMADELSNKNLNGDQRMTQNPYEEDQYFEEGENYQYEV